MLKIWNFGNLGNLALTYLAWTPAYRPGTSPTPVFDQSARYYLAEYEQLFGILHDAPTAR
jgi:hypothetical protein